ncbi:HAD hydrolase-like protein [Mycolicibacterium sarraceniae]|uniref:Hydrolase n=1 Tax=Mycolicibacterium sarraceniae TaxID=1534348 RepID=A0A7I7SW05_9MYCO|nr:HAD hydrolase-like protein [Mycolicibacterium sarraceniae]BBY60978.1 hypothetical protein MSAR_41140 [Mycolicibacterium sarraceniae]
MRPFANSGRKPVWTTITLPIHVGDRLDNDILPARAIGMRTVFIRRGPWGHIHALKDEVALADLRVNSLQELATYFGATTADRASNGFDMTDYSGRLRLETPCSQP